ncbi:hypothetical protein BGW38_005798, partial [Lunasporangiospora selenospora]
MTANPLTLFCLVDGKANAFSVEIESTKTVDALKKLIKDEKAPRFNDVAADELTLWRVSVPVPPKKNRKEIWLADIPSKEELDETDDIVDVFKELPPKKTIHIIVQRPPRQVHAPVPARSSPPLAEQETEAFQMHIERIKKEFFQPGAVISDFLRKFVEGEISLPEADCCVKGLPKAWLRSSSFAQKSARPALYLLHPTQPHQTTSTTTPPSVAALETISNFQNNDMITFFGVSGCGKTRAVVEMLAQTWGFYLNGSQADRGSMD